MNLSWTTAPGPMAFSFASLGEDGRRIAYVGRTAVGIMVCLYPSGAPGSGRHYRVASVAQGRRFVERWAAGHERVLRRHHNVPAQPLWQHSPVTYEEGRTAAS